MISYLCTPKHAYTINRYLSGPGAAIANHFRVLDYSTVLSISNVEKIPGAYIFSDIDRLPGHVAGRLAKWWSELAVHPGIFLLNHPTRSMRRFELLRTLFVEGINDFDVWRLTDPRTPHRFPIFIRRENSHNGAVGKLISDSAAFSRAKEHILNQGHFRDELLVVEFSETRGSDGYYKKYAATRINDIIVPHHIDFSTQWIVSMEACVHTAETWAIEKEYLGGSQHTEELMRVFEIARIEFGRIDYSIKDGKILVWEINTNPSYVGSAAAMLGRNAITELRDERFIDAYRRLELRTEDRDRKNG